MKIVDIPWLIATGEALRSPKVKGRRPMRLMRRTVRIVFVSVEIMAEDQIVFEQLARGALHPVRNVVRPASGVARIQLRSGEGREHAGEQTEHICRIGVVDTVVAAERSAGKLAMRVY